MDFTTQTKAAETVRQWFLRDTNVDRTIPRGQIRPPISNSWDNRLRRASPESVGISSAYLIKFYERLQREQGLNMQTLSIWRGGSVVSQGEFFPYKADIWHVSHSMSKSIISLCIGILRDDGKLTLNDRAVDILANDIPPSAVLTHRGITIRTLLTMSTGIRFNEAGSVTDVNWVKGYFESGGKFRPGTDFEYNSMNTYILSAIICKLTGGSVTDFLKQRLFGPLGITDFYWETCPLGIEKGGWGLYYYPEDMLRVAELMLNGGVYGGKRIISEQYLNEAMNRRIRTPVVTGNYDYGYQMWVKADGSVCMFNGMFGQNLICFPKIKLAVVMTAGNDEFFQRCPIYDILERYFGGSYRPSTPLPEDTDNLQKLRAMEKRLCKSGTDAAFIRDVKPSGDIPRELEPFLGEYTVELKDGFGLSLLPEIMQGVHNNFCKGLLGITLSVQDGKLTLACREADGERKVAVGFDRAERGEVCYGGESFLTASYATLTGDNVKKLRVHVCFPELPNVRVLTIIRWDDGIRVKWEEEPGYHLAYTQIVSTINESLDRQLVQRLQSRLDNDFFIKRLKYFLQPTVSARRADTPEEK